jgi:hypothetical protein
MNDRNEAAQKAAAVEQSADDEQVKELARVVGLLCQEVEHLRKTADAAYNRVSALETRVG